MLLFDGERVIHPDELQDQSPRAAYKADEQVREIERDVAKRWLKGNIRIACLGFENQTAVDPDIVLRVYGYDGAEYRWQLTRDAASEARYPVVTLVLYFGEKRWDRPLTLYEAVNVPDIFRPFVSDMKVNLFEIAFLPPETVRKFRSDFRIVADYFVQKRMTGDYQPGREKIDHVQETLHMLSVMTKDHRFEDVMREVPRKEAVSNMCEVLDRIELRGMTKGMTRGRAEGIAEGMTKGIAEGMTRGIAEGLTRGKAEGKVEGMTEGESRLAKLMMTLKDQGRVEDAFRAAADPAFREKMYAEFNIA